MQGIVISPFLPCSPFPFPPSCSDKCPHVFGRGALVELLMSKAHVASEKVR